MKLPADNVSRVRCRQFLVALFFLLACTSTSVNAITIEVLVVDYNTTDFHTDAGTFSLNSSGGRTLQDGLVDRINANGANNDTDGGSISDDSYGIEGDWEATYDANVTTSGPLPMVDIPVVEFVLVNKHDNEAARRLLSQQVRDETMFGEDIVESEIIESRVTEVFFKSSVSYRITARRNETIWRGYLRAPTTTLITTSNTSDSSNDLHSLDSTEIYTRTGFCTIYEAGGKIRSATFTTETTAYDLLHIPQLQKYEIRASMWTDFPPEDTHHEATNTTLETPHWRKLDITSKSKVVSNVTAGSNAFMSKSYMSVTPDNSSPWITNEFQANAYNMANRKQPANRTLQQTLQTIVDVLIIVSNRGMCEYAGLSETRCPPTAKNRAPMEARLQVALSETNNAMLPVNVQVRFTRIVFFDESSSYDPMATSDELSASAKNIDIQSLRKSTGSDLVAIVAGKGGYCGIANLNGSLTITNQMCLKQYTLSHEIGHCFGCNHNRESFPIGSKQPAYAVGFLANNKYRTMLSLECATGSSCPRVPYYSSATLKLPDGRELGDATTDNLRFIMERASAVANLQQQSLSTTRPTTKPVQPVSKPSTTNPIPVPANPLQQRTLSPKVTKVPSQNPNLQPTIKPDSKPTMNPSLPPKGNPENQPTLIPTVNPVMQPTNTITQVPSHKPTETNQVATQGPIIRSGQFTSQPTNPPQAQPISVLVPTGRSSIIPTTRTATGNPQSPTLIRTRIPIQPPVTKITTGRPSSLPIRKPVRSRTRRPIIVKVPSSMKPTTRPSNVPKSTIRPATAKPVAVLISRPIRKRKPITRRPTKAPALKPAQQLDTPQQILVPSNQQPVQESICQETCSNNNEQRILNQMYRRSILGKCIGVCVPNNRYIQFTLIGFGCKSCKR